MRIPKLSRKQKTARNLLFILLALALFSWDLNFPSWTKEGLLRRTAEMELLEEESRILYEEGDLGGGEIYAENSGVLFSVSYDRTLVGLRRGSVRFYNDDLVLTYDSEQGGRGEQDYRYPRLKAVGQLEEVAVAEVEISISGDINGIWTIPGERQNDCCFAFNYERQYEKEDTSPQARAEDTMLRGKYYERDRTVTMRFYDAAGELTEEITKTGSEYSWYPLTIF